MEVVRSHKKANSNDVVVSTLPLYRSAPPLEVRLDDFELFAIDRLRVLKGISDGLSRGKKPEEMEKLAMDLWKANMGHLQATEDVNKDIISHFVLRLVYCRTEELRKWFLSMETSLFRYRFRFQSSEAKRVLMSEFKLPYKTVSNAEFESVKDKLGQAARSMGPTLPAGMRLLTGFVGHIPHGRHKFLSCYIPSLLALSHFVMYMTNKFGPC